MSGKEDTFKRWIKDYRGIVFKVTRAYAWSPQDREDLSQEVFLQLWRSVPSFQGHAAESTWVYKVALNTAMTWRRDSHAKGVSGAPPDDTPCPKPLPDDAASAQELVEWLYKELALMSKVDRSIALLYLDGFSYRSMAEVMGISESNVGVKLNRIKNRLAERVKGAGHGT